MVQRKDNRRKRGFVPASLDKIASWGRSLAEYIRMFDLTEANLGLHILDCAAGPASFNAEMHGRGHAVISCDPIYAFSAAEIARRIKQARAAIRKSTEAHRDNFVWTEYGSIESLARIRMAAMKQFLADLPLGLAEGRYRTSELPALPFRDLEFDLALCSHFLFTYSDALPLEFHLGAIREMCRVASEARIFPLLPSFGTARSPHAELIIRQLSAEGYRCEIRRVPYEFQRGGNETLCVHRDGGRREPGAERP